MGKMKLIKNLVKQHKIYAHINYYLILRQKVEF